MPIVGVPMGTGWLSSSQKGAAAHTRDTPRTVERDKREKGGKKSKLIHDVFKKKVEVLLSARPVHNILATQHALWREARERVKA